MSTSSDDETDMDYHGQINLAKLKSLRHSVNWEIEEERREFLHQLYPLVKDWKGQHPDLRDIFRMEEIDWLLSESVKSESIGYESELKPLVKFVIRTGYKDKPDFDKYGKPVSRRTTPVHLAARSGLVNVFIVPDLFKLYDRFDVNYTDESGLTHFYIACRHECIEVVKKFLKHGQDPNCVILITFDSPLHTVVRYDNREMMELLLRNGANPNLANAKGWTPVHVMAMKDLDNELVDIFFKINDALQQTVQVDAKDNRGRTPLQLAVSNLMPHVVDVLLNRGADLSKFVFPTESDFAERSEPTFDESWDDFRLRLASGALGVVEHLEKRGYELDRGDAATIMKLFAKHELFEKLAVTEQSWYDEDFKREAKDTNLLPWISLLEKVHDDDEEVARKAREMRKGPTLSLYELIESRPEEAEKRVTFEDYFEFGRSGDYLCDPFEEPHEACAVHLCEKLSRGFFRRWALDPFRELVKRRLPIEICELIMDELINVDLLVRLKSLRETIDWEIEEERREFLRQLYPIVKDWEGQLPDLRDIFGRDEIEWLLNESAKSKFYDSELEPLVQFVIRTGYKDKLDFDRYGKPMSRRTTPIHHADTTARYNCFIIHDLFEIYDRFDVNYTDESGYTHFHIACRIGCDGVVEKFLELGQDPNCVVTETGDTPLHLALRFNNEEVFELLMKSGADPNLVDAKGLTALHMIAKKYDDDELVDLFFKICNEKNYVVPIDPLDNRGRTPLFIAVSNFLPHIVDELLDHGADLSKFVFPAENDFRSKPWNDETWDYFRLRLVSGALAVIGHLEKRGYKLNRSEALIIMKFFAKYKLFEKRADFKKSWYDDEKFARLAKRHLILPTMKALDYKYIHNSEEVPRKWIEMSERPDLTLYDLILLRPEEAEKRVTPSDYFEYAQAGDFECFPTEEHEEPCLLHLCEKMSRRFFRRWALEPFLELTHNRLPILCCEIIIENLMNEDLWNICLAAESPIHKDSVLKCKSERPARARKAPERLQIECDDDSQVTDQYSSVRLQSLRETIDWEIEEERREFLRQLYPIVKEWEGQLPDLRDIFRPDEIDWLLSESVKSESIDHESELEPLVNFVVRTGYKDKPDLDKYGKPVSRRTTPIHHTARLENDRVVADLFKIYDRFDVNHVDDFGYTHFHAACRSCSDKVVKKFIRHGQDPNCVVPETGDSPLHLALDRNNEDAAEVLLLNGADPNSSNCQGSTPLHLIAKGTFYDSCVERFFKICDETKQKVRIDARDSRGRTPLFVAVSNLMPCTVDVLLQRGADVSSFVFPTESDFDERSPPTFLESWDDFKLRLASGALCIVELLEKRGYELNQSDALIVVKIFAKHKMFEKRDDIEKSWYDEEFAEEAEDILIDSDVSLDDLIRTSPEEATKRVKLLDFFVFASAGDFCCFPDEELHEACLLHLCEKLSRTFFRRWTLRFFLELTQNLLPILCCEMIIENLMNEDLCHICLATESPIHEDNVKKESTRGSK
ncbi:unnamed protein product [Trichogramma brassicae]|uniref:Uncharacterized protein n=1 Tax=Trichogramma brassicae TaxID=86971 RepID=A0A6H5IDV0_9HYME|nr:unnamed protein product [Trichogramma brassicae]